MAIAHIRLNRDLIESALWSDDKLFAIFVKLVFRANYKPQETIYKDKLYNIERGELSTSFESLSNYLKINYSTCRRSIKKLEKFGFIFVKSDSYQTTIKINNYDNLCAHESDERTAGEQTYEQTCEQTYEQTCELQVSKHVNTIKELKNLRREEIKNERSIALASATRHPVSNDYILLGDKWLKIALEEYPWRLQEAKWTGENFGRELEKIAKSLKASPVEMQKLFERFEKDPFWRKNAASPFGLTKRSQNGLRKIDNMIASLRTEFERKQSSQTNLADLRKQFQEDFKTKEELEKILEEEDRNANRY
jgi:DNA-binding Lrp family transcriptional regulator